MKSVEEIDYDAEEELCREFRHFAQKMKDGTNGIENFLTLDQIESEVIKAIQNTKSVYLNAVNEYLSNCDESAVIKLKKENTQKRG